MTDSLPIDTPFLAVDIDVMDRNLQRAAADARQRGVALRPHAKTHKVPQIAQRQLALGAVGLTLATVSEAEVFADAGFTDIFIAYPVWPSEARAKRLRALAERVSLRLGVDSVESAEALGRALAGVTAQVMVEVDSGHHRSGAAPDRAGAVAASADRAGLQVAGVFTFPGHGYSPTDLRQAARDEADAVSIAAFMIERAGLQSPIRSGGSTPTRAATDTEVINELRPGVYVFNDSQQAELGVCDWGDIALTAHATVVSRRGNHVIVDAGSKILGADRPGWATGFGRLPDMADARVVALSEHHATVHLPDGAAVPELGTIIRIAPNHVCAAVNLVDELVVLQGGSMVDRWRVAARGANS
jgi:D-serine deaminase-like pyridoxal phosphate-dependent protein